MKVQEKGVLPGSEVFFHTPSLQAQELFLTLVCTGRYTCSGAYMVHRNSYESGLMLMVLSGSGYVLRSGERIPLHAGDTLLLDCFEPHCYGTDTGFEILWLHFRGKQARPFLQGACEHGWVLHAGKDTYDVRHSLDTVYHMFADTHVHADDALIHTEITKMLSHFFMQEPSHGMERMDMAAAMLSEHLDEKLTTEEIANRLHLSESQLNRAFKKRMGISPHQYRMELRLQAAEYLLLTTEFTLTDIAAQCGFQDASALSHFFRSKTGDSPGNYALKNRKTS